MCVSCANLLVGRFELCSLIHYSLGWSCFILCLYGDNYFQILQPDTLKENLAGGISFCLDCPGL